MVHSDNNDLLAVNAVDRPIIIINDFLKDPDAVREYALKQNYGEDKAYPGHRTPKREIHGDLVEVFARLIGKPILKLQSVFQIQPAEFEKQSFIHGDLCDWAAVLYLNTDCDGRPGTCFYRHKSTNSDKLLLGVDLMFQAIEKGAQPNDLIAPVARDRFDFDKWELLLTVPCRYNRLLLYNAKLFHRNASAWGKDVHDARLVQGYFVFTEPFGGPQTAGVDVLEREGAARSV